METKDYVTLIISLTSISIASTSLYFNYFRKALLQFSIGNTAHLYHPRDGGTAIYLDVHILNETSVKGKIRRVFLEVDDPDGNSFKIAWRRRAKMDEEGNYHDISSSDPFFVEPKSFSDDLFWFWWPPNSKIDLKFIEGKYNFRLFIWQGNNTTPTLSNQRALIIEKKAELFLKENLINKNPSTWIKPFAHSDKIGIYLSKDKVNASEWWMKL